jgi:hypothetical protein
LIKITGLVLDKKIKTRRNVLTEEKLDDIGATLESSQRKLLTKLDQYADLFFSARTATK